MPPLLSVFFLFGLDPSRTVHRAYLLCDEVSPFSAGASSSPVPDHAMQRCRACCAFLGLAAIALLLGSQSRPSSTLLLLTTASLPTTHAPPLQVNYTDLIDRRQHRAHTQPQHARALINRPCCLLQLLYPGPGRMASALQAQSFLERITSRICICSPAWRHRRGRRGGGPRAGSGALHTKVQHLVLSALLSAGRRALRAKRRHDCVGPKSLRRPYGVSAGQRPLALRAAAGR